MTDTHENENHKDGIPPKGRHDLYEGRGEGIGAWKNRRRALRLATVLRK